MQATSIQTGFVLLVLAATVGSSTRAIGVETHRQEAARSWIGLPYEQVETVWGANGSGESDGYGGKVYTFREEGTSVDRVFNPDAAELTSPPLLLGPAPRLPQPPTYYIVGNVDAKFWVNAEGKIYRVWFSPKVWKRSPLKTMPAPDSLRIHDPVLAPPTAP